MITLRQQRGAALFIGILLITVVVVFAAVVALTSSTQHLGQARAGLAQQAWYAAVARMEGAIESILSIDACPAGGSASTLGYDTVLSCSSESVSEGGDDYEVYTLEVTASQGSLSDPVFVRRSVRAQVAD